MKFGLIGNPLGHSWSPAIHAYTIHEEYQLRPLQEDELDRFFAEKDFAGINVTIPYKQTVMKYLDEIDPAAKQIGAVNCIINQNGILKGYNTDYSGLKGMLERHEVPLASGRTAILGSGGASKACAAAVRALGGTYDIVSRQAKPGTITYEEMYERQEEYVCLMNATPVGMYPACDDMPADPGRFDHLRYVVDIVANPLRTRLQWTAEMLGIPYLGGFEMLVRQAADADELFTGKPVKEEVIRGCMNHLLSERRNIVLIGMPTSGKTTLAAMLESKTGRTVRELDDEITEELGMSITECFAEKGEKYFRDIESLIASRHREGKGEIISCGGGIIKREINMRYLGENGVIIWVNRAPKYLFASGTRPLSSTLEEVAKLYEERISLYEKYSDIMIDNNAELNDAVRQIIEQTGAGKK